MKRDELKPNTVYKSASRSWRNPAYFITGNPVVTIEQRAKRGTYGSKLVPTKVVKVRPVVWDDETGQAEVKPHSVEVVLAQVEQEIGSLVDYVAHRQDMRQRAADAKRRLQEQQAKELVVIARLAELGVTARSRGTMGSPAVSISVDQFDALLAALDRTGVTQ